MKFNKGAELDKQIYKEGQPTWGCKSGVLDVDDVKDFIEMTMDDIICMKNLDLDNNNRINRLIERINSRAGEKFRFVLEDET